MVLKGILAITVPQQQVGLQTEVRLDGQSVGGMKKIENIGPIKIYCRVIFVGTNP